MTRNWKWLALAALAAFGGPAAAQECPFGTCNTQSREPTQVRWSTQQSPRCEQTLWECLFSTQEARHGESRCASECVKGEEEPATNQVWARPCAGQFRCINEEPCAAAGCGEPRSAKARCSCSENCARAKAPAFQCGEGCPSVVKERAGAQFSCDARIVRRTCEGFEIITPSISCSGERVRTLDATRSVVLLEGNVELILRGENQPARITAERAIVNLRDGSYEVMGCNFVDSTWTGRVKPMSYVVPTPAERGWR